MRTRARNLSVTLTDGEMCQLERVAARLALTKSGAIRLLIRLRAMGVGRS